MGMQIDEARRHHKPRRIDLPPPGRERRPDGRDPVARDPDIGDRIMPGFRVDDPPPTNDQIEHCGVGHISCPL